MAERIDQNLARTAARALQGTKITPELRSRMRALPIMLQTSGLAATCAFLLSKATAGSHAHAYRVTAVTLLSEAADAVGIPVTPEDPHAMLDQLSGATGRQYLVAEMRASMLAIWLSRLAQARAEEEASS